ncbi:UNVERIFIED_ORG: hypothetical protein BDU10_9606 [Burkholderia sp. CF145]|nr:hypothetical protein PMI06_008464 [Burkholderia sp. BT03]SKC47923.1 hypothetical protein SAMN06266956_0187 [Paraburkholderia hospita]
MCMRRNVRNDDSQPEILYSATGYCPYLYQGNNLAVFPGEPLSVQTDAGYPFGKGSLTFLQFSDCALARKMSH